MAGEMSCYAAHDSPFDASLGIRRRRGREKGNCRHSACKSLVHRIVSPIYRCGFQTAERVKSSDALSAKAGARRLVLAPYALG